MVDNGGAVIASSATAEIPKNTSATDWHYRTLNFNPGANTDVRFILRTNLDSDFGNHLVLDDISAVQVTPTCNQSVDITVNVEAGRAFSAQLLNFENP